MSGNNNIEQLHIILKQLNELNATLKIIDDAIIMLLEQLSENIHNKQKLLAFNEEISSIETNLNNQITLLNKIKSQKLFYKIFTLN